MTGVGGGVDRGACGYVSRGSRQEPVGEGGGARIRGAEVCFELPSRGTAKCALEIFPEKYQFHLFPDFHLDLLIHLDKHSSSACACPFSDRYRKHRTTPTSLGHCQPTKHVTSMGCENNHIGMTTCSVLRNLHCLNSGSLWQSPTFLI